MIPTDEVVRRAETWVERAARFGYVAKGSVYVLVGLLSVQAAFDAARARGAEAALRAVMEAPFGRFVLGLIALGLAGYSLWEFAQTALAPDTDEDAGWLRQAVQRGKGLVVGVIYGFLAYQAARLAIGGRDVTRQAGPVEWVASLLSAPLGRWAVGAAGAVVVGYALFQVYRAGSEKVRSHLKIHEVRPDARDWVLWAGRIGYGARAIVFGIIGYFFVQAAITVSPEQARGVQGALRTLGSGARGQTILFGVAAGLAAYGIFELIRARYRHIEPDGDADE